MCPADGTEGVVRLLIAAQKSAEGIVGQADGEASEALQGRKAEQQISGAENEG